MWNRLVCFWLLLFGLVFCSSALGSTLTLKPSPQTTTNNLGFFLSDITEVLSLAYATCQYCNPDSGGRGVGGGGPKRAKILCLSVKNKTHLSLSCVSFSVKAYSRPLSLPLLGRGLYFLQYIQDVPYRASRREILYSPRLIGTHPAHHT